MIGVDLGLIGVDLGCLFLPFAEVVCSLLVLKLESISLDIVSTDLFQGRLKAEGYIKTQLDCYWVGPLDFNFLVEIKLGCPINPQKVKLFAGGSTATKKLLTCRTNKLRATCAMH